MTSWHTFHPLWSMLTAYWITSLSFEKNQQNQQHHQKSIQIFQVLCKFHFITIENLKSPDKFHKTLCIRKLIAWVSCWFWKIFMSYWLFDNASFTANIGIYHSAVSPMKSNQIICCLPNTEHWVRKNFRLQLLKSLFSGVIQIDIISDPDREKDGELNGKTSFAKSN